MKPETAEWVEQAEGDYIMAELGLKTNIATTYTLCILAEQATEKYLKAFLVEQGIAFLPRHTTTYLLSLCLSVDAQFASFQQKLVTVDQFYVDYHYPPGNLAPIQDVQTAYQTASDIRAFVRSKLGI